jgi:acetyltransferase-like isoleucine patch superfamily enzyme
MSYIDAFGGISIGNDVSIAHGVTILSSNHNYQSQLLPIKDQGMEMRYTKIEDDVWIGAKATVLGGVTICKGTIVAAGAVVTKTFKPNQIIAGIPANVIGER